MSDHNKFENGGPKDEKKNRNNRYRRSGKRRYPGKKHPHEKELTTSAEAETMELDIEEDVMESDCNDEAETDTEMDMPVAPAPAEIENDIQDDFAITEPTPEAPTCDPTEMTEVIGVRFRSSGKIYYFDNKSLVYPVGCHAIVDTARGMEYGEVALTNRMVPTSELVLPLREALRIATPDDDRHFAENKQKEEEAREVWVKKIAQHNLEMKLIDVECTFDNSKLLFYFTAEGRVDFRDLVKDLASVFRCRIELRQMGIRDEAKILGGLGVCGRPFCCHSFLPDFVQVSIKMAKEQNLSLNSAKISGACGRLMCCLRYEYETYLEEAKLTPKVDSLVHTPDGVGKIVEAKPLLGLVKVQLANSPDAPAVVYARDLVKVAKPGELIEEPPVQSAPVSETKDKSAKAPEKKPEAPKQRPAQPPRKRPNEQPERKNDNKRVEKIAPKQENKPEHNENAEKADAVKQERKYVIQRASDNIEDTTTQKKREGGHHRRKNYPPRDRKDKKPTDAS